MSWVSLFSVFVTASVVLASPRLWVIEDTLKHPATVGGIAVPHHERHIIEGPGGYSFDALKHLPGISPYFDSPGVKLDPSTPDGCHVTKATYLIRHSNIYGNDYDWAAYLSPFLSKLADFPDRSAFAQTPDLAFLADYTSPITNETEQLEQVTPSGKEAAAKLGGVIKSLYPDLLNSIDTTGGVFRVWAASADRDVETANAFIGGLGNNAHLVVVPESKNASANTLAPHGSCPAFHGSMGSVQSRAWIKKYTAPLIARFNQAVPGFNFTLNDVYGMQQLCGYDKVVRNRTDFCNVFTPEEWLDFEYANDIMYHYSFGYGSPISPQLGMPWVRSALDILSAEDTSTFNQSLYVSFTHREEPPLILTALNLFNNSGYYPSLDVNTTMPSDQINFARVWKTVEIVPFLGHVGIERLQCTNTGAIMDADVPAVGCGQTHAAAHASQRTFATSSAAGLDAGADNDAYIRVLVNGAPIPIPNCQDGPGQSCALGSFADYIQERIGLYGDFIGACGIPDTVPNRTNLLTIYQNDATARLCG